MIKLLNAGFRRLRKSKIFWLFNIFSVGLALFVIYTGYSDMKTYGDAIEVEQLILNYSVIVGIAISIFTSLFLGVEYSDGGIRNKISIGHKRTNIYLSNLIITTITSLLSYVLWIIVMVCIGIPIFGGITISISQLLILIGCISLNIIAYSSLFTFLAMLISNKTITSIVSIMLAFGLMMVALTCLNILGAPKFIQSASMTNGDTGEFEMVEEVNPKYPSEQKRKVCQTLLDINPAGQMFELAERTTPNVRILPLYSSGIIVLFTGVGLVLFKKKELK